MPWSYVYRDCSSAFIINLEKVLTQELKNNDEVSLTSLSFEKII